MQPSSHYILLPQGTVSLLVLLQVTPILPILIIWLLQ